MRSRNHWTRQAALLEIQSDSPSRSELESLEPRLLLDGSAEMTTIELLDLSGAVFVENAGQWRDSNLHFACRQDGTGVGIVNDGVWFSVPLLAEGESAELASFRSRFVASNPVAPVGLDRQETSYHFFVGDPADWRSSVSGFAAVAWPGIWDGVDLRASGRPSNLKYELRVAPGGDWTAIAISYEGIEPLWLDAEGDLRIPTAAGVLEDSAPVIWQEIDGRRVAVEGSFRLIDEYTYGFAVAGPYDPAHELVIDPNLAWATYLGSTWVDEGDAITVDSADNIYIVGSTSSIDLTTPGGATAKDDDAFVAILNSTGTSLMSVAYLGGSEDDCARDIALDSSGNIYVVGDTGSPGWATPGAYQTTHGGSDDIFVAKLDPTASTVLYCTYLGGTESEEAGGIAVDAAGNAYVVGDTLSSGLATPGAYDTTYDSQNDVIVAKLNPTGSDLVYCTYLGATWSEWAHDVVLDPAGNAYVAGATNSIELTVPGGSGPKDTDAFVAAINSTGTDLLWEACLEGSENEEFEGLFRDSSGSIYVVGRTTSSGLASPGAYDTTYAGGWDGLVAKLDPTGPTVLYQTYLGSTWDDEPNAVVVDAAGNVYVAGTTDSIDLTTPGGTQQDEEGFVAVLDSTGTSLLSATYLGGSGDDSANDLAFDSAGDLVVVGQTESPGWATPGTYDPTHNGLDDAYVAKLTDLVPPATPALLMDINPGIAASDPRDFVEANGTLFFTADDGAHGRELWKTDGTAAGTVMVKDILPGSGGSAPDHLTNVSGMLFFGADDGTSGRELWKSDGTPGGTARVQDIFPGSDGSCPEYLASLDGAVFFAADDGAHGRELWTSDGTPGGTVMVKDISPGADANPRYLTEMNGMLFFSAHQPLFSQELWRTDGTEAGTQMVKNIRPICNSWPQRLTNVDGTLFFTADDGTLGYELWKSDGTADGTVLVKDIHPGGESAYPRYLEQMDAALFFSATDGALGYELWKSDGTPGGTVMVRDVYVDGDSWPQRLTHVDGTLFFTARDGTHGYELWKTDGTSDGTTMVRDIFASGEGSYPQHLTNVDGALFFGADDGACGFELWTSDGTQDGTVMVADVNPGSDGSCPTWVGKVNERLLFVADDGQTGHELWELDRSPVAAGAGYGTEEDTLLSVDAAAGVLAGASDPEGRGLTAVLVDAPIHGTLMLNSDGSFTYMPEADFYGRDSFTYKANDGRNDSNAATIWIYVAPANDAPVANDNAYSTNEDTPLAVGAGTGVLANDTDVEGEPLWATPVSGPSSGTLGFSGDGSFTYTPDPNFNGKDSFTYKANDGLADSNVATVTINVAAVDDAPVAGDDTYSTDEDIDLIVGAPGVLGNDTDPDGGPLTAYLVTWTKYGELGLNPNGSFGYTRSPNFNGIDSFAYKAYDGLAYSNTATVTIIVNPVNDAPVANDDTYSTDEDTDLVITVPGVLANDTDVEDDPLSALLVGGPSNGSLGLNDDGSLTYSPSPNFNGIDSFTYKANDGLADSDTATVTITVNPVNDAPVANDDTYYTDEDTPLVLAAPGVLGNDTEAEGDPLTAYLVTWPKVEFGLNPNGSFTYWPSPNFNGIDSFTYKANDGQADSNTATVVISVASINDPPTAYAGPDQNVVDFDGSYWETVPLNGTGSTDVEGLVSYVWAEDGVQIATGALVSMDFEVGTHTIELTVTDTDGVTDTDDVTIVVSPRVGDGSEPVPGDERFGSQQGNTLPIRWDGGEPGATAELLAFGPSGLTQIDTDVPIDGTVYDWDITGLPYGWYTLVARTVEDGQRVLLPGAYWVHVDDPAAGRPAGPASASGSAGDSMDLTWLRPTDGDEVRQGEAYEIRWQVELPEGGSPHAEMWACEAATLRWFRIADDVDIQAGRYRWDTTAAAPGTYRFRLRVNEPGIWPLLDDSDCLEVL